MNIIGKCLTIEEFKKYCAKKSFAPNNPNKLVLHHSWKPDVQDWNGAKTIAGLKKYYEGLQWSNGPHIFCAEDGIWLFTDMNTQGIHAGTGNFRSIGIEVVGNYDPKVWKGKTKENALSVLEILMGKLVLDFDDIFFHSQFSSKTCPGKMITKKWLRDKIAEALQASLPVLKPTEQPIPIKVIPTPPVTPQSVTAITDALAEAVGISKQEMDKIIQEPIQTTPVSIPRPTESIQTRISESVIPETIKLSELPKIEPTLWQLIIKFFKSL